MPQAARGLVLRPIGTTLWLGGMSGVGKTTAARTFAREHDLWFYSLDSHTYEHAAKLPPDSRTLDEIWVDQTPAQLADWFEDVARQRFPLVLDDIAELDDGAPVLVDGPQVLPELVGENALFVVASPVLQRELAIARGSDLYARTRDPERALENRLERDRILVERLRAATDVVEIANVRETEGVVADYFEPLIREWIERFDHVDGAARIRWEESARERQRELHRQAISGPRPE